MTSRLRLRLQILTCVLGVAAFVILQGLSRPIHAAPSPKTLTFGNCDEECGPAVSCDQDCWAQAPELPPFQTSCGEYGGGPWNGIGQCLGECGDGFCNPYNGEEYGAEGCPQDCGMCGDSDCDPTRGESPGTCPEDCGTCGDGRCNEDEGYSSGNYCTADCGVGEAGDKCIYPDSTPCEGNEYCTPHNYCANNGTQCAPYPGYTCLVSSDCCSWETCRVSGDLWGNILAWDSSLEQYTYQRLGICVPKTH